MTSSLSPTTILASILLLSYLSPTAVIKQKERERVSKRGPSKEIWGLKGVVAERAWHGKKQRSSRIGGK